ncbi:TPA: SIR2 family protein [Stenotrophomonas maltophilia]
MARTENPTFSPEIGAFIDRYVDELVNGNASVFLGAGMSVDAGFVNWKGLLKDVAAELGLDVDRETNLVALAQYHFNERNNRSVLNQKILAEFTEDQQLTPSHNVLARLPISHYWTTNYDRLIETALTQEHRRPDVKFTVAHMKLSKPGHGAVVYKMHGDVEHPDGAILTKDDYEGYFREHEPFVTALSGDLVQTTMLFLGFSFTDPNIDYVLSRVRVTLRKKPKNHYCVLCRLHRLPRERKEGYEYRKRQQEYLIKDLSRLGIQALMIDQYKQVPEILGAIESRYRQRTVFVSGAAHVFPSSWNPARAHQFLSGLSSALIRKRLNVVTGFGLGVGTSVVSGALETILSNPGRHQEKQLQASPFPVAADSRTKSRLYRQHREKILGKCGIAIFAFGSKLEGRKTVLSQGMRDEFNLARDDGLIVIPIGATGSVAKELWEEVSSRFNEFYPNASGTFARHFKTLGRETAKPEELTRALTGMIDDLRRLSI